MDSGTSESIREYAKYVYDHSVNRFSRVDQKAATVLAASLVVAGIVAGFARNSLRFAWTPMGELIRSVVELALAAGVIVGLVIAVRASALALLSQKVATPPLNDAVFKYGEANSQQSFDDGLAKTLNCANAEISEKIELKSTHVRVALVSVVVVVGLLIALFVIEFVWALIVKQAETPDGFM